jgi:hypothetical protein
MNLLIVLRFNLAGLGFVLFYEFSKFYVFGDRFLAEGLIVYPVVYMTGIAWNNFQKRKIYNIEYVLFGFFTWLIVFAREPYIPLVLALYIVILWKKPLDKFKFLSIFLFLALTFLTLMLIPLKEYVFNVFTINLKTVFESEAQVNNMFGLGLLKSFLYPIFLFFGDNWNFFRYQLLGINIIFISSIVFLLKLKRIRLITIVILLILGLANLRIVEPGKVFYEAFHFIIWYGMFLFISFLALNQVYAYSKRLAIPFFLLALILFGFVTLSQQSFIYDRINPHEEFMTNFGKELQVGEVVRKLSSPKDTLFLDGFDDLIYWQAKRLSPYKYSWYTSMMPAIPKYAKARLDMFKNNPPDFYYGSCPNKNDERLIMPKRYIKNYTQLYSLGLPTCLYVYKAKLPDITEEKWMKAKELLYELPKKTSSRNGI